ncbi:DUF3613 domain-containing protein [Stenotrophomonas sp. Sa5BUN4]|uniref:DUF3613 domain-containing protein n=1 Tax=Stenotrophomonas lacuserhaii TaxID=2760084 RepID=A0A8X8FR55_9GAMM|nr:DUF3613 domain-containing protein [Stenotrophomonas pennii]MBD7952829.1 DUF3613 domain-containing protein [Stenotrophomonas pennii]
MTCSLILARGLAMSLLLAAGLAHAQQAPVTGRMLGGTSPAPAPARPAALGPAPTRAAPQPGLQHAAPPPPPRYVDAPAAPLAQRAARPEPGDATRHLLRLQASGAQGGRGLPVLGDQAHASYARYLKSFEHDIPEFFENTVGQSTPGGSN